MRRSPFRRRRNNPTRRVAVLALLATILLALGVYNTSHAQETTPATVVVTFDAPTEVAVGELITLRLRVQDPTAISGFEALFAFDSGVAEFAGFAPAPPAPGQGRGQLIAPLLAEGSAVGAYTCSTDPCLQQREAQVSAAAADDLLGEVELIPLAPGRLHIELAHLQLVDASGQLLIVELPQRTVVVRVGDGEQDLVANAAGWDWPAPATQATIASIDAADVTQDGQVAHSDLMEIALAWTIVRESGAPCGGEEPAADINQDGCVDIVDVQTAAAFAGSKVPAESPEQDPEQVIWNEHLFLPNVGNPTAVGMQAAMSATFIVDSILDEWDAKSSDGVCRSPSNVCTLRAAIQQANSTPGSDTILFNIPGEGVHTIQIDKRLPSLWDATGGITIDGYSQPGAAPNSDASVSNAQIRIEIRGNGFEDYDGLAITTGGNVVKGLAFYNLKRSLWIYGGDATDNVIAGNFIGTNATATFSAGTTSSKQAHGIHVEQAASNNRIGGASPADRNVISGNARHGVGFWHVGTDGNVVIGNIIGLTPDGTARLANRVHGMDINYGASYNTVGGTEPGERNLIAGNHGSGAEMSHGRETTGNVVAGNYIGTDASGNAAYNYTVNGNFGVSMKDRVVNNFVTGNVIGNSQEGGINIDNFGNCCTSNNTVENNRIGIGVSGAPISNALFGIKITAPNSTIGPGNIIANNPVGIRIDGADSDGNRITQNAIFANAGLGIDLAPAAEVNANDEGDVDSGPNEQLNFPVLADASVSQARGSACAGCTVEIFVADSDAGAHGEGRTFAGTGVAAGDGTFMVTLNGVNVDDWLSATATDSSGNTSEFAANFQVTSQQPWEQVFAIPGRIEAEDYRAGGEGTGYSDTTAGNSGRAYRSDNVDIEVTQDSSGSYDIGWIAPNEWLAYEINVATTATYQMVVRVATPSGQRRFHIEIDGNNVTGSVTIPWTGGWQNWTNVTVNVPLTQGQHTLRFVAETDRFNLNYMEFVAP